MSARVENWPSLLAAFIEQRRCLPFAWGSHDCCQFARMAVLVQTGVDPAASWKLRPYTTSRGAAGNLRRLGGVAALPALAGLAEITVPSAGRGDIILCLNEGREVLGVSVGRQAAFAGPAGLAFLPTLQCSRAWRL